MVFPCEFPWELSPFVSYSMYLPHVIIIIHMAVVSSSIACNPFGILEALNHS